MSQLADRYNDGKVQWSLMHMPSLVPMVKVLMFGAKKYAPDNWQKGLPVKQLIDSLLRHTYALMAGERTDPESGESHAGHILCNAMFLSYMLLFRPDMDDLPDTPVLYSNATTSKQIFTGEIH